MPPLVIPLVSQIAVGTCQASLRVRQNNAHNLRSVVVRADVALIVEAFGDIEKMLVHIHPDIMRVGHLLQRTSFAGSQNQHGGQGQGQDRTDGQSPELVAGLGIEPEDGLGPGSAGELSP